MKHKKYVQKLRNYRRYHRSLGIVLAILLLISCFTGLLLSWKKEMDWIQPKLQRGVSKKLDEWKSLSEIGLIAKTALQDSISNQEKNKINKIDVRPQKGSAKVLFEDEFWEIQIDGHSGEVLSIAKRHSDWIEDIHDGSILGKVFKLTSMNILGFGTIILIITGFWLWYGPKLIKKIKERSPS